MSQKEYRLRRDVLWNFGSIAILGVSGLAINWTIMFFRGAEALGVFNQVFALYIVASQLAVGGVQYSTLKHCSYVPNNPAECSLITTSAMVLVAVTGLFVCAGMMVLRGGIGELLGSAPVATGIAYAVPGLYLFSLNKVMLMSINALRNMRAFALFQALRYILILISILGIIALGGLGSQLALSLTIAETVIFLGLMSYVWGVLFQLKLSLGAPTRTWCKKHISFGARGFMSGVLVEMNTRVDVIMVGYFLSDRMVGLYSFGALFAEGYAQISTVLRQNVDPIIGEAFSGGRTDEIETLSKGIRKPWVIAMASLGAAAIAGFSLIILSLRAGDQRWMSWGVFAILVLGVMLSSGYRPFSGVLLQGGRPGTYSFMMFASVCSNVLLNLALIPILGIYGSAMATSMVYCLEAGLTILFAKRLFGIRL